MLENLDRFDVMINKIYKLGRYFAELIEVQ